ncbi:MAG TPA: hypothetical protein VEB59_12540 [Gemmatimonadales bacterium]|nr:hypothetical protein [Gemmatimonadales bacterium]
MSYRSLLPTLALIVAACSGDGDVTGPDPAPHDPQVPQQPLPGPQPVPQDPGPEDPPPPPIVAGGYTLVRINASEPGQLVTIANPDGIVVGLYRFTASTMEIDPLQTWALELRYTDDKSDLGISDAGDMTWATDEQGILLHFDSEVYGDSFTGRAGNGLVAIRYDFDGDGTAETTFTFARIGG